MSAAKLGILLIRTIAKPIASSIKEYSKRHPYFKQICINIAQATHRLEIKLKMNLLGQKSEKFRPLNDKKAVEIGANFLGESIVFGVAGSLIIWEQRRSYKNSKERQNHLDTTIEKLREEISEINSNIDMYENDQEQMRINFENLKNDNEKLKSILNQTLNKGLGLKILDVSEKI
ncbi:21176_t:CDS:2 [Entrophospora sp. SA101]|nr:3475_t:CDS:2 [Entrophospora sp. SA101]CAJ0640411.1 7423_t:CDS:2 [Entrophospora sp. SA101]CAJ0755770.1 21176_t:CDS:2 [Entrophospora sp. SA101]CAJ0825675.1 18157_t:CDS:2 [Entrophospora sp. SA101]CAJ0839721.1 5177_t:CDS:2 [Entrophospora sp. SA101]